MILLLLCISLVIRSNSGAGVEDGYKDALVDLLKRFDRTRFRDQLLRLAGNLELEKCQYKSQNKILNGNCGVSVLKGRRATQEDNVFCISGNRLPSLSGDKKYTYSLLGVFDGHGGKEASALCSSCFHEYLLYYVYNTCTRALESPEVLYSLPDSGWSVIPVSKTDWLESYFWRIIIKEAISKTIIHAEAILNEKFLSEGGTTACIAIEMDGYLLVANVGDSKALLCSSNTDSFVEELTVDHHPDRDDEKLRIETSGGFVEKWGGIPRVAGVLAVSRSIGDFSFKKYGVISEPEFTGWRKLDDQHKYLVVASDGVFESLSPQEVCSVIEAVSSGKDISRVLREKLLRIKTPIALLPPSRGVCGADGDEKLSRDEQEEEEDFRGGADERLFKLASALSETALKLGSSDNLATVVYTLGEELKRNDEEYFASTSPAPVFSEVHTLGVKSQAWSSYVPGVLVANQAAQICYSLMRPLRREIISPVQFTHDWSLEKVLTSSLTPCFTFSGPVCQFPTDNVNEHLPANIQFMNDRRLVGFIDRIASVPYDAESYSSSGKNSSLPPFMVHHYRYILKKKFGRGSFGEIWLAVRKECKGEKLSSCEWQFSEESSSSNEEGEVFVLKQIMLNGHIGRRLSGIRERHFGEVFLNASRNQLFVDEGVNHIARFVDSFVVRDEDLWLVFKKEGQSLSKLLYDSQELPEVNNSEEQEKASFQVLSPSSWWRWLKSTEAGQQEMRSLLHQLLLAVKACHDRNITHRDIKPENIVVQTAEKIETTWPQKLHLRIIDFGSAIDPFTLEHLYGASGPTRSENTREYSPPEATLLEHWMHLHPHETKAYDMWSIGVVMLEMILGTPHVFQISSRTRLLLDRYLAAWDQDSRNVAYILRAFMEMCILLPHAHPQHNKNKTQNHQEESRPALIDCSEAALLKKIQQRDSMGLGVPNVWALRLLRQLLQWYPEDRISVDEALQHPYFHPEFQNEEF